MRVTKPANDLTTEYRGFAMCYEDDKETRERCVWAEQGNLRIHYPGFLHTDSLTWKEDLQKVLDFLKTEIDSELTARERGHITDSENEFEYWDCNIPRSKKENDCND